MLDGKRVMYYNQKGDRHPRGTLELNAGSRLKKIVTKDHAFHVVSDKQVSGVTMLRYRIIDIDINIRLLIEATA